MRGEREGASRKEGGTRRREGQDGGSGKGQVRAIHIDQHSPQPPVNDATIAMLPSATHLSTPRHT